MTRDATLVIMGATGDLTSRLLLPALGQMLTREPDRRLRLIGSGVDERSDEQWRTIVHDAFASADAVDAMSALTSVEYRRADITAAADLTTLLHGLDAPLSLYFAVPPGIAAAACDALRGVTLPPGTTLALEKPFGTDLAGARALNRTLAALVPEEQVFRVDHFLGRSTLLNLLGARFANRVFEPVWSADDVESVDVCFDESLALEGRAGYYDRAGALVDMIQSHLLQVLAFIAMEPPATLDERDLRAATAAALRATHVWQDDPVRSSRRARYTGATLDGHAIPSYVDEPGVDPSRDTETLAELTCEVRTSRWAGVPFTLRSGKALGHKREEIVVRFRPVRHLPVGLTGDSSGSVLRFSLGPDTMSLELSINSGEDPFELTRAVLQADMGAGALLAYAEVLSGVLDGDAALSVRGDSAEECWRIVTPVIEAWRAGSVPMQEYPAGSEGPSDWRVVG